jgi:hypothetical protein
MFVGKTGLSALRPYFSSEIMKEVLFGRGSETSHYMRPMEKLVVRGINVVNSRNLTYRLITSQSKKSEQIVLISRHVLATVNRYISSGNKRCLIR